MIIYIKYLIWCLVYGKCSVSSMCIVSKICLFLVFIENVLILRWSNLSFILKLI